MAKTGAENRAGGCGIDLYSWYLSFGYKCAGRLASHKEDPLPMGISLYVTQGVFLLLASRDPLANRGVITFAAWLNIAHAGVMTVMAIHLPNERQDLLVASALFAAIGATLIALTPGKQSVEKASSVVA